MRIPKGHWPRGKRRHEIEPAKWLAIRSRMNRLARLRLCRSLARRSGIHVDTIRRYRTGEWQPSRKRLASLAAALNHFSHLIS